MAPESERANYMQRRPGGMCFAHGRYTGMECPKWPACATDRQNPDFVREGMRDVTRPNEPTLTCSEVVERLATECCEMRLNLKGWKRPYFDRELAKSILHSWRERRVQELEEALRKIQQLTVIDGGTTETSVNMDTIAELAENALKSDEWREQIRKGAKHE